MAAAAPAAPKAVLYTAEGSLWASVPALGLIEKGYGDKEYSLKHVDLAKAENLSPEFLRLNPRGTIPVLVVPVLNEEPGNLQKYKSITDSVKILEFLDVSRKARVNQTINNGNLNPAPSLSPATITDKLESDQLIGSVHSENHDLNFLSIASRNEADLKRKAEPNGWLLNVLRGRRDALENYLETQGNNATQATKAFWEEQID